MDHLLKMENQTMVSKRPFLGIFGMIKSAIGVPLRSSNFIVFTFLAFLPHFSATLLETLSVLLTFIVAITTVHSSSKIHMATPGSTRSRLNTTLPSLVRYSRAKIRRTGVAGPYLTFLVSTIFSNICLEGPRYWVDYGPLASSTTTRFSIVVHGTVYWAGIVVWSSFCAFCNLGVVISIMEGKMGLQAFSAAADLMRGNWTRGTILMVLYALWRLAVGLMPTLSVLEWLLSVGAVMNCVILVVYYYDCKNRQMGTKSTRS